MEIFTESYVGKRIKGVRAAPVIKSGKIIDANDVAIKKLAGLVSLKFKDKSKTVSLLGNEHSYYMQVLSHSVIVQYMNMHILAQVLLSLHDSKSFTSEQQANLGSFEDQITPYVNKLIGSDFNDKSDKIFKLENVTEKEYEITRIEMLIEFLRYVRFVKLLEEEVQNSGDLAQKEQAYEFEDNEEI